jgi:hypothetical protein
MCGRAAAVRELGGLTHSSRNVSAIDHLEAKTGEETFRGLGQQVDDRHIVAGSEFQYSPRQIAADSLALVLRIDSHGPQQGGATIHLDGRASDDATAIAGHDHVLLLLPQTKDRQMLALEKRLDDFEV